MYLPQDDEQMLEILVDLRLYAAMHGYSRLAEVFDDTIFILQGEARRGRRAARAACHPATDKG